MGTRNEARDSGIGVYDMRICLMKSVMMAACPICERDGATPFSAAASLPLPHSPARDTILPHVPAQNSQCRPPIGSTAQQPAGRMPTPVKDGQRPGQNSRSERMPPPPTKLCLWNLTRHIALLSAAFFFSSLSCLIPLFPCSTSPAETSAQPNTTQHSSPHGTEPWPRESSPTAPAP